MKQAIGGYFELEISNRGSMFHDDLVALNSGRNALEFILRSRENVNSVYLPYYTCDVLLEPLKKLRLNYKFYSLENNLLPSEIELKKNDVIIYTNYFGINQKNVKSVIEKYSKENVIVDNSQAFFDKPEEGLDSFYSPRKFFGVSDGGFATNWYNVDVKDYKTDFSTDRIKHLVQRIENGAESGYQTFKENDHSLNNQPIKRMSYFTKKILTGIDYDEIKKKRLRNFEQLHERLSEFNKLSFLIENAKFTGPFCYPYWVEDSKTLRAKLSNHLIYTATYWPNVRKWCLPSSLEFHLTENIIFLPIDQRYDNYIMQEILSYV